MHCTATLAVLDNLVKLRRLKCCAISAVVDG